MTLSFPRALAGGLTTIALGLSLGAAHAGTITFGSTGLAGTDKVETFENPSGASYEAAAGQFAANGVTFSGGTVTLINRGQCNPGGLAGSSYIAVGVTPDCGVAQAVSTVSMKFSEDVEALSFLYTSNNRGAYRFEALLDGTVVSSSNVAWGSSNGYKNGYFTFGGSVFDEIRFTGAAGSNWFWIDNMAWDTTTGSVPEPASLGLVALAGLGALGARRRRAAAVQG